MKVVDFFKIPSIAQVHQIMKIPPNYYTDFDFSKIENFMEWVDPLKQGKEISADDDNLGWDEHGFIYDGRRIRLYIRDRLTYYHSLPKYHLTWCKTLQDKHNKGELKKYVVSTSTDDKFLINWVDGEKIVEQTYEKLSVCKNCLFKLKWKGYDYKRNDVFENFSIEEFFETYNDNENQFAYIPGDTDLTAPPNVYPNDWAIISRELRENRLQCTKCHRKFTMEDKRMLHVHHRNGIKSDCKRSNLVVLCAHCHQEEHPDHQIMLW